MEVWLEVVMFVKNRLRLCCESGERKIGDFLSLC